MENFRDAELKKWLAEEYEKETEEMEKILFPDGVIPDDGETEEEAKAAYQRLVEKLKADGVYKEDETDSIKTDDHKENVKIVYLPEKKSHKAAHVAAAVLVCSAGIFAAIIAFGMNSAAYVAEIVRSGIMAVDIGQTEASRSLGFNNRQTMTMVVLPQAIKNVLPALGNEIITLLKETSVAGYVALADITYIGNMIRSRTYEAFFPLITVALIYLVIVLVLSYILRRFERRLKKSER